jgi:DNA-binding transcriptional regulator YdaS (Cro superfamily)
VDKAKSFYYLAVMSKSRKAALERAIKRVGGPANLARLINISHQLLRSWLQRPKGVTAEYVIAIEKATGVSRHDLRPDIYPREKAA